MPVADTEVLFALSPRDPKHSRVLQLLRERADILVPDVAVLEFQAVLRTRGRTFAEIKYALLALREVLARYGVKEVQTLSSGMLVIQCELEEKHGLSFFDSLVAAAALARDREVVSGDKAFDAVPGLARITLE